MVNDFNKNKLTGNNGENIIEYLINSCPDWNCLKFGVEAHVENLKNSVRKINNPITLKIRKMPDFVAFNEKTEETFFTEVKYSSNPHQDGYFLDYLEDYNLYWPGTKLIIVRQIAPHFIYVDLSKINDSMKKPVSTSEGQRTAWHFGELAKDIKELFPDLKEEDIEEAKKKI